MVVLPAASEIVPAPLSLTVGQTRPVDLTLFHDVAEIFFA